MYSKLVTIKLGIRITSVVLVLFVASLWLLTYSIASHLQQDMTALLSNQQLAVANYIATDLDYKVRFKLEQLEHFALQVPENLLANPKQLEADIRHSALAEVFKTGVLLIAADGHLIAEHPIAPGRAGTSFTDREFFKEILATGKPALGKPQIARFAKVPLVAIAVPIKNKAGQTVAMLAGLTELADASLFGVVEQSPIERGGWILVVAPRDKIVVSSSIKSRILEKSSNNPPNEVTRKAMQGIANTGVVINSRGMEILTSAAPVRNTGWIVYVTIPTRIAFASIQTIKHLAYTLATIMSLFVAVLVWLYVQRVLQPLSNSAQRIGQMVLNGTDMTALPIVRDDEIGQLLRGFNLLLSTRRMAEQTLRQSEKKYRSLFDNMLEGIAYCQMIYVDHQASDFVYLDVNPAFVKLTGLENAVGKPVSALIPGIRESNRDLFEVYSRVAEGGAPEKFETYVAGLQIWFAVSVYSPERGKFVAVFDNITDSKKAEARINFLAYHDALTELPNRLLAWDRFQQAVAFADRHNRKVALLYLDLDHFKHINESLGHTTGDQLLVDVVARLQGCVRDTDTISRQGGDEFLIVLTEIGDSEVISRICGSILAALTTPFDIDGSAFSVSASIGATVYPDDGKDFDELLKKADTAMYCAKEAGRNTWQFFSGQMNIDADARLRMANDLRSALDRHEFVLYYQPQIDLNSGAVIGAEALLRWQHGSLGLVAPGKFIPIAEESGLIVPIGEWVLREVTRQAAAWQKVGLDKLVVAANLSAIQFKRGNLEAVLISALHDSGLDPACLELELTESILIGDTENVLQTVRRLKALGVNLSIDDFGTGYSSLSYLKRFTVDKVKIDQSFVRDIASDPGSAAIVRAIIQMARSLGLKTIAEGVEEAHMLDYLRLNHCDEAQGYHIARPMPADDFLRYALAARRQ